MTAKDDAQRVLERVERLADLATFDIDLTGPYIGHRSPAYRRLHGLPSNCETEQHQQWLDRLHPDDRERAHAAFRATVENGAPYDVEYRIRRANDGAVRWIAARGEVLRDAAGKPARLLGIHIDITRRREAEAGAQRAAERYAALFHANPIGILEGDVHGAIHRANDAFLDIVGYDRADLETGRLRWDELTPAEHLHLDLAHVEQAKRLGRCEPYEKEYIRKDGTRAPVLIGFTLIDPDRERSVAYILDRRAAKLAAQKLEAAQRRHEAILNQLPAGVLVSDTDGKVTYSNAAADAMFPGPARTSAVPELSRFELLDASGAVLPRQSEPLERALRGEVVTGEELAVRPRGAHEPHLYIHVNAAPLVDAAGARIGAVAAFEDVTAARTAAAALSRAEFDRALALEAGRMGSWSWRVADGAMSWDEGFARLLGYEPGEVAPHIDRVLDRILPPDRERLEAAIACSRAGGREGVDNETYRMAGPDGAPRWLASRGAFVTAFGEPVMHGVSWDVTEAKRDEERQRLLMHELNHRVKNSLAVVQSLVSQTLRTAPSLQDARETLAARLRALAGAHDLLVRSEWRSGSMHDIVEALNAQGIGERLTFAGPHMELSPAQSVALAMVLHELATNAMKYGALAVPTGWARLRWRRCRRGGLTLVWRETGGPPVKPPQKEGFGLRLIRSALQSDPSSKVDILFRPSGLTCRLHIAA